MPYRTPKIIRYFVTIILALSQFAMAADEPLSTSLSGKNTVFNDDASLFTSSITEAPAFLPVEVAFQPSAWIEKTSQQEKPETLVIHWQIAPDYYLYKHRFKFTQLDTNSPVEALIPDGKAKQDEYFGDVEVYYHQIAIKLPAASLAGKTAIEVGFQGCADAGLCYPPQTLYLERHNQTLTLTNTAPQKPETLPISSTINSGPVGLQQGFTEILASAGLLSIIGLFFLAGLALTFTPCVLPMIPIISSIVLGQSGQPTRLRAFSLSLTYVLAMAGTYALAGTLTGYFGAGLNLQLKLQSPLIIFTISALFVAFALAMLGLYELRLPSTLQNKLQKISQNQRGGTYVGVASIGVISTLIVSPCVTAPLAGTLVFISSTGDPLLGGLALLSLGLGMGLPLLLIGTFGLQLLPKSGLWMNQVKILFGILLLGLAIWMLDRIIPAAFSLLLWVALLMGYALHLGLLKLLRGKVSTLPLMGLTLFLYSALLAFNASQGHFNPFTPLKAFSGPVVELQFRSADNLQQLQSILAEQNKGRIAMLDLYADWCVSCLILEQEVFTSPAVGAQLQQLILIRADITDGTAEHQALLKHFGLFGPPSLLFFDGQQELRAQRIQGEVDAEALQQHLAHLPQKTVKEADTFNN